MILPVITASCACILKYGPHSYSKALEQARGPDDGERISVTSTLMKQSGVATYICQVGALHMALVGFKTQLYISFKQITNVSESHALKSLEKVCW